MDKLSESQEDYLKKIYEIHMEGKEIRVTDIALQMGISKPSVNKAINMLKQLGLISHEHYGCIELTPEGIAQGEEITENYKVSYKFLVDVLGVPEKEAEEEADGMEHILTKNTRKRLKKHIKKAKETSSKKK